MASFFFNIIRGSPDSPSSSSSTTTTTSSAFASCTTTSSESRNNNSSSSSTTLSGIADYGGVFDCNNMKWSSNLPSSSSIIKKEESLAIGNILGSNIFNLLAVYSIPGLTYTHLNFIVLYRDYYLMTLLSFLAYAMSLNFKNNKGVISRFEGGLLVLIFIGYEIVLFNFNQYNQE